MTVGMPARRASATGRIRARSSSGERTRASTPAPASVSTIWICSLRSSSLSGPFQMISTPSSRAAVRAPAWTDFQNSWVVPMGMTAILNRRPAAGRPSPGARQAAAKRVRPASAAAKDRRGPDMARWLWLRMVRMISPARGDCQGRMNAKKEMGMASPISRYNRGESLGGERSDRQDNPQEIYRDGPRAGRPGGDWRLQA